MRVTVLFTLLGAMSMLPSSLSTCADSSQSCQSWTKRGYCTTIPKFMLLYCCKSCATQKETCKKIADIVMVVDESESIGRFNFGKIKDFLMDVVSRFSVSRFRAHFGVVAFSSQASVPIQLNAHTNMAALRHAIRNLRYSGGGTYTGRAFDVVRTWVYGTRADRKDAPNVVVLISDGASSDHDKAIRSANQLKKSGVQIICIAVGKAEFDPELLEQLEEIASRKDWVFQTHFNAMDKIENDLVKDTCEAANPCNKKPCLNSGKCTVFGDAFHCTCAEGYTGKRCESSINPCDIKPCVNNGKCSAYGDTFQCICPHGYTGEKCEKSVKGPPCKNVLELVMAIDETTSVRKYNFRKIIGFVSDLVARFHVAENGAHFGVVTFAAQPRIPISLKAYTKPHELQRAIRYIEYYGGGRRYTGEALDTVRRLVYNSCSGRKNAPGVVVLFTNGASRDHATAVQAANFLKRSGVDVICVAVGPGTKELRPTLVKQLKELASKPELVFHTSFNNIQDTIENKIVKAACEAADVCKGKPCKNNGKCLADKKTFRFKCACPKGYKGKKCEVGPCDEKPCLNNAKCTVASGTFKCTCTSGYGGKTCAAPINVVGLSQSVIVGHNHIYLKNLGRWLPSGHNTWKRCWRASVDGWAATTFHKRCNGKRRTVTIVQVGSYVFGGYSNLDWSGSGYKGTSQAFLFSLKNKDNLAPFKSTIRQYLSYAVYRYYSYGPSFGNGPELYIANNAGSTRSSSVTLGRTFQAPSGYSYSATKTNNLLAGSRYFTPSEIEVFYRT